MLLKEPLSADTALICGAPPPEQRRRLRALSLAAGAPAFLAPAHCLSEAVKTNGERREALTRYQWPSGCVRR